jgi:hypothetical protein
VCEEPVVKYGSVAWVWPSWVASVESRIVPSRSRMKISSASAVPVTTWWRSSRRRAPAAVWTAVVPAGSRNARASSPNPGIDPT